MHPPDGCWRPGDADTPPGDGALVPGLHVDLHRLGQVHHTGTGGTAWQRHTNLHGTGWAGGGGGVWVQQRQHSTTREHYKRKEAPVTTILYT